MRLVIVEKNRTDLKRQKLILDGESDISVVGAFVSAGAALRALGKISPDTALVDLDLPDMPGIEFIQRANTELPKIEIMVHTALDGWKDVYAALKAGAKGYLLKDATTRELIDALIDLHRGGAPMSPRIARMVIAEFHGVVRRGEYALTPREKDILSGMEKRMTYRDIADMLRISPFTVRTHIRNIYEKIEVKSKEEAIRKARKDGAL